MHFRSDALCGPARKPDPVGSLVPPCKPAANVLALIRLGSARKRRSWGLELKKEKREEKPKRMASEEYKPLLEANPETELNAAGRPSQLGIYLSKVQNHNLYLATFAAVLGPLSFGFVLGYSSPAIPSLKRSHNPELRLDDTQASWFGSVVTLGAAAGGTLGGYMVDKIGRKLSLMLCAVPYVFGFLTIVSAQNVWMLYLGRLLCGLASGIYISETSHSKIRGVLGSCVQLMVVTGILGAYLAGHALA
ncbi:hypothetical protein E2320_006451 [Naja naja]|nr:hypothetical protein E2320_006451 [Naja naja]